MKTKLQRIQETGPRRQPRGSREENQELLRRRVGGLGEGRSIQRHEPTRQGWGKGGSERKSILKENF